MSNVLSATLIMQELQSLRTEVSQLKSLLTNQNEPAPETTYIEPVDTLDYKISILLQEMYIPANIKGYSMLREAIKLGYHDVRMSRVTKFLYPVLAKKFDTTPSRAERAIRHAIEISYSKCFTHPLYKRCYPDTKPTNAQFVAMIVDKFKLEEPVKETANVGL